MLKLSSLHPIPAVLTLLLVLLGHKMYAVWAHLTGMDVTTGEVEAADASAKAAPESSKPAAAAEAPPTNKIKDTDIPVPGAEKLEDLPQKPKPTKVTTPFDLLNLSTTEVALLQELGKRHTELENKAATLVEERQQLKLVQEQVLKQIAQLKEAKEALDKSLKTYDEKTLQKIKNLVKIYENMKPKEAARILEALDVNIVLEIIEHMKEAKTSPILSAMQTEKAKEITGKLLHKKQSAGT